MQGRVMEQLSFKRALMWIVASTVAISGSAGAALYYYHWIEQKKKEDNQYLIDQISTNHSVLSQSFLAEVMEIDKTNLYRFDVVKAEKQLLSLPFIKHVKVSKHPPNRLDVHYTMRKPKARLSKLNNAAVDVEGFIFPIKPFYFNSDLPEVDFGEQDLSFEKRIPKEKIALAWDLFELLPHAEVLDLSRAQSKSAGLSEVIAVVRESGGRRVLRLPVHFYQKAIEDYKILRVDLKGTSQIIDLRVPGMALVNQNLPRKN